MENPDSSAQATSGSTDAVQKLEVQGAEVIPSDATSIVSEAAPVASQESKEGGGDAAQATPAGGVAAPHPKKFSAFNINKKFLEKNTATPGSSQNSLASTSSKSAGTSAKPSPALSTSHSRLVTTKLTALAPPSTTTGPGWSRPASATPPVAPSPGATANAANVIASPAPHGPPQLPHVGKVIQPQPRGVAPAAPASKQEGLKNLHSKPVWGNLKPGGLNSIGADAKVQNDFPTAAEVAQARIVRTVDRPLDKNVAPVVGPAQKQAAIEADTFRGVHLDPNAHHWDEEEDNDDFLGGVIEFGDGRQYQIQPADADIPIDQAEAASQLRASSPPVLVNKEDRFADDFDRSWPRSNKPPVGSIRPSDGYHPAPSASSASSLSPQDLSRVLFNERSNRLEPYSNAHSRPGNNGDSKPMRDVPPHHNVQLLQKGPERGMNGLDHDRPFRDSGRRVSMSSQGSEDRPWDRGRRISNAQQTLPPHSARRETSREGGRQLPPHLASLPPPPPPPHRQPPPREREPWHHAPSSAHEDVSPVSIRGARSPSSSRDAVPSVSSPVAPAVSPLDVEDARKAAMHTAAERARIRRQQEEEEREKEKERARKKAAELEAKMKALETPAQTVEPREADTHPAPEDVLPVASSPAATEAYLDRTPLSRPPSLQPSSRERDAGPRPFMSRTPSFRGPQTAVNGLPPTSESSWRSKAAPLPPLATRTAPRFTPAQNVTPVAPLPPVSLSEVPAVSLDHDEGLEEVDFTELGKFVGVEEPIPEEPAETEQPSFQASRPVATDFFDAQADPTSESRSDVESTWRRKPNHMVLSELPPATINHVQDRTPEATLGPLSPAISISGQQSPTKSHAPPSEHASSNASFSQTLVVPPNIGFQRSPRTPAYREASMSALDDTMSRIKGALNVMHGQDVPRETHRSGLPTDSRVAEVSKSDPVPLNHARPLKWAPPAMKQHVPAPPMTFAVTSTELEVAHPRHPPHVHLPRVRPRALPPKLNMQLFSAPPPRARLDNVSWNPCVEGMTTKDYSINGVLFDKNPLFAKSPAFKSKLKLKVVLPQSRLLVSNHHNTLLPKVNLPDKPLLNNKAVDAGAFGRPRADEQQTWRRNATFGGDQADDARHESELETVSRSPPPDPDRAGPSTPKAIAESTADTASRSRSQPKMPAGAAVAFYRDSHVDLDQPKSSVRFIVSSELEDGHPVATSSGSADLEVIHASSPAAKLSPSSSPTSVREKPESKSSDGSSDHAPLTPPTPVTWSKTLSIKDSPRRPDPDQIKMLWAHPSAKAEVTGVNSLEGIADDLSTVPFSLQDVKSEDGETPPPTVSHVPAPSRLSLHDVTRAFQTVPSAPAGPSTQKAPAQSSPLSHPAVPRQPSYPPPSSVPSNMRPAYPGYPSPMMSHSPAPGVMYPMAPSPVSGPMMMNGPSPQYWMLPGPGGQTPGAVMRPLPSPYPQYMAYPSPGGPPMYGAGAPPPLASQPNTPGGAQNRGRTPAMMSPVLPHARPPMQMYQSSPVLMHAPVMHVQPTYAPGLPAGRGDGRGPYGAQMVHHPQASNHPPAQQSGYAPPASYGRPAW
ncbi:hypothetical protein FA95DRAFT_1141674 [Auriscalpium vulgare]|uniref:Uncharacterized protein n=1 Tax=Auriscalpium vulgare TaxID=40419 RepID=A0ACB8RW17_9AGAM|nr:hypothetical protein FA95DRAFT_1141674 [Auriscalpium vulgare]